MKLTKSHLKQIIKEEMRKVLQEDAACAAHCEEQGRECGIPSGGPTGCFCGDCGRGDCKSGKCHERVRTAPLSPEEPDYPDG